MNVGQTVAASFSSPTLYTIANDLSKMQVLTTVDESDIGRISIGQMATFSVDAYPDETFKGTISQIRLNPVTVQNVVNYTVVVDVNNDQFKLMPGMTANVNVHVADAHNVLLIPNMALRFQPPAELVDSAGISALRNAFAGRPKVGDSPGIASRGADTSGKPVVPEMKNVNKTAQFGIELRFPEYEKPAYTPLHQAERGRVWVLNTLGKLEPVFLRTGVTDGKFTEITSPTLKAGDQIVMGATMDGNVASTASPLMGGGPGPRPGGPGGFR